MADRIGPLVLLVASFVPTAAAQGTHVVPPAYATQSGNSPEIEPFGYDRIRHAQYADRTLLAGIPVNTLLKEIAYRRSPQVTEPASMERKAGRGFTLAVWQVRLANYTGPVLNPSSTFPQPADPAWTMVFSARQIDHTTNCPPLTLPATGLPAFQVRFPFDQPVQYTGAGIGIEHYAYEGVAYVYTYLVDGVWSQPGSGTVQLITPASLGCPAGQNRAQGFAPNPGGGTLDFYLFGAPPGAAAIAYFGASKTSWSGIPLPLDLTANSLPGCFVYTDLTLPFPATTSTAGTGEIRQAVPGDPAFRGATLYGQWLVRDPRVNPSFPYATSDGLAFTLGTELGQSPIAVSTVSGTDMNAQQRVGLLQPGRGAIFQLRW